MNTLVIINSIPGCGSPHISSFFNNSRINIDPTLDQYHTKDNIEMIKLDCNSNLINIYPTVDDKPNNLLKYIIKEHNTCICLNILRHNMIDSVLSYYAIKQMYGSDYNVGVCIGSDIAIQSQEYFNNLQLNVIKSFDMVNFKKYFEIYINRYKDIKIKHISTLLKVYDICTRNNKKFIKYDLIYDHIIEDIEAAYIYLNNITGFKINTINTYKDSDSIIIKYIKDMCLKSGYSLPVI